MNKEKKNVDPGLLEAQEEIARLRQQLAISENQTKASADALNAAYEDVASYRLRGEEQRVFKEEYKTLYNEADETSARRAVVARKLASTASRACKIVV